MAASAGRGHAAATDLADWLVRQGAPFREAHHATGSIVAEADRRGTTLADLPLEAMTAIDPRITDEVYAVLDPARSVSSRSSFGGTAPANVTAQANAWIKRLDLEAAPE
jgi:argininosuccinate lyase